MRGRDRHEAVAAAFGHGPLPGLQQRLVRTRERDLVDDHQLAGVAGDIDALPQRQRAEQAGRRLGDEPPGQLAQLGVALAEDLQIGQFATAVHGRGLGRPLRGEQAEGASACRPEQFGHLGQDGRRGAVPAGRRQRLRDVQDALTPVVEGRADVETAPLGTLGLGVTLGRVRLGQPHRTRDRVEVAADRQRRRGEYHRALGEDALTHQPRHRQGCLVDLSPEPFPLGHPHHVVRGQRGQLIGDVEDLLGRRGRLGSFVVRAVAAGHRRRHPAGDVANQPQGVRHLPVGVLHPGQRRIVEGGAQRLAGVQELQGELVVQPGQAAASDPFDQLRTEFVRGGAGDPGHQFVRLVDDHRVVLGQRGAAVHCVDGQQRMVGDHQLRGAGLVARPLHEALRSVGAALGAQAFAHRDGHLGPGGGGVRGGVVAVGRALRLGLGLHPLPQRDDLGAHLGVRVGGHRGQGLGEFAAAQQGLLLRAEGVADPVEAGVIGASLQDGVADPLAGDPLAGVQGGRDVLAGELRLQRQRGGGDHHPVAGRLHQVRQRRRQVSQRLAGAGAGLDEQVVSPAERFGDRGRHLVLAGTLRPLDALDRGGENRFGQVELGHRINLPCGTDATGRRAGAEPAHRATLAPEATSG